MLFLLSLFPFFYSASLRREADAYFAYLATVCLVWTCVALVFDLLQCLVSCAVKLEFEDVDVGLGFDNAVCPSLALLLFGKHNIGAENAENQVERIVEIAFLLRFHILAAHSVRYAGKECREAFAPYVEVVKLYGAIKLNGKRCC